MENSRREIMAGACAAAAMNFAPAALAAWEPSQRYPDPAIQSLDPSFNKYRLALAGVERLATSCRFNEGAVYFGDARCLLWSDIPNNRIMRWVSRPAGSTSSVSLPITPTATPATDRAASSLASIQVVASHAPSMTALSRC
jgi:gluconolactonase